MPTKPDRVKEHWDVVRTKAKEFWPELTDKELGVQEADQNYLCSLLQQKYGYSKSQADAAVNQTILEMQARKYL